MFHPCGHPQWRAEGICIGSGLGRKTILIFLFGGGKFHSDIRQQPD